jgi:hypothetical protein
MSPARTPAASFAAGRPLVAADVSDHRTLIVALSAVIVLITLGITVRAGRRTRSAVDSCVGGRRFGAFRNGLGVPGDYMSAASSSVSRARYRGGPLAHGHRSALPRPPVARHHPRRSAPQRPVG